MQPHNRRQRTHCNLSGIKHAYSIIWDNGAQSICGKSAQVMSIIGHFTSLTSYAKNRAILKFISNGILNISVGLIVNGSYQKRPSKRSLTLPNICHIPVASSNMMTFAFLTNALASETSDRYASRDSDRLTQGVSTWNKPTWPTERFPPSSSMIVSRVNRFMGVWAPLGTSSSEFAIELRFIFSTR